MNRSAIYAGPGRVYMGTTGLWPEGDSEIGLSIEQELLPVVSGFHGHVDDQQGDCVIKLTMKPFDSWSALALLFPTAVKTPARGTRIYGAADVPCSVWTSDSRLYTILNAAVTKHPELNLGVGEALFGDVEITGLIADGKSYGDASSFLTVTESGGSAPSGTFAMTDFTRGRWTGVWGTATGFGGEAQGVAIEAADKWVITPEVKYTFRKAGKLTRTATLESVRFMAKCKPVGPTHTQLLANLKIQDSGVLGARLSSNANAADLVLTGPGSKTITLNKAMLVGAGYRFGDTELGTGEVGWVATASFTAGAIGAVITFSA